MALLFDASTERVAHGSAAILDDIQAGTMFAWINVTNWTADTGNQVIVDKAGAGANNLRWSLWVDGFDGSLRLQIKRATTALFIDATPAQLGSHHVVNAWLCVAAVFDLAGAAGDQHLYSGALGTTLVEASAYATQQVGSGAINSNAADTLFVGGEDAANRQLKGRVGTVIICNTTKTLAQLRSLQFRPRKYDSSCVLYSQYGFGGTGTQADLSGNGNNGTVTGATVDSHVPLGPTFGFDLGWMGAFTAAAPGGRTTRNIHPWHLGISHGMGHGQPGGQV